jgi:hypothetical protein
MVETFPISKKEGSILSSIGLNPEDVEKNRDFIGVKFEEREKSQLVLQLIVKGYLALTDNELSLTESGKDLITKFDIAILKED